jgi:protein gp37
MTAAEKDKLGAGNTIFVGSSTDMWASDVPDTWISEVLRTCRLNPSNTYLFQSKNPIRFINFIKLLPPKVILGTTIETNRDTSKYSKALPPVERYGVMKHITTRKMVSIEPVMDFDLIPLINWISEIKPEFVSIGADSGNNHLPEPDKEKLKMFIEDLKQITEVKVKNLGRLL